MQDGILALELAGEFEMNLQRDNTDNRMYPSHSYEYECGKYDRQNRYPMRNNMPADYYRGYFGED